MRKLVWVLGSIILPIVLMVVVFTLPSPAITGSNVSFVAMGDYGSGLPTQMAVAKAMFQDEQRQPFGFVLTMGDNIYPKGEVSRYGKSRFLLPYKPLLDLKIPFYPTLGNHDVLWGHSQEEISFFKMPGPYYDFVKGDIHFFALDSISYEKDKAQQAWLARRLAQSHEPWKIVYAHFPIFSSGHHGSNKSLEAKLRPVLEENHVNLYLTGHEHDYERFAPINGVVYIVSGGGGAPIRPFPGGVEKGSQVRRSVYHFMRFDELPTGIRFEAIDQNGHVFDSGVISPWKS